MKKKHGSYHHYATINLMHRIDPIYVEHQLKRWTRPDAHHFVRPDWRCFLRPEPQQDHPFVLYERKYSSDQPRVPAGGPDGGQWTSGEGAAAEGINAGIANRDSAYVRNILSHAKQIAAGGYSSCLDKCFPILERPQPKGVDFNQWDFHKCMNACLGKNR